MEFHGTSSAPISLTWAVPWNYMELTVRQFRWHEKFHGIPWNLKCANFVDTSSSMEFHGIWSVPISLTRAVPWNSMELQVRQFRWHEQFHGIPWNSMELGVRQFRWHEKFHGIPWNLKCASFADTSSSMEFHGIPNNLECANITDTSSSMEFHGTWNAPISMTRAVPWNSVGLGMRQFRWHEQFHGIPWDWECANFDDTSSSMEFHGTWNAPISMTRAVPWNSVGLGMRQFRWHEQFHGIPCNLDCANITDTSSSMEFHGTWNAPISMTRAVPWNSVGLGMRQFRWHEQFHGIPWDWECANFDDTSSSMEFHGSPWNLGYANFADTSSPMEFHGTWSAPISLTRAVPRNSMEFRGTRSAPISLTRAVPWDSMEFHGT